LILGGSSNIAPGIWPTLNGTVKTGGTWPVRLKKVRGEWGPSQVARFLTGGVKPPRLTTARPVLIDLSLSLAAK
jgi:hypothetical protein